MQQAKFHILFALALIMLGVAPYASLAEQPYEVGLRTSTFTMVVVDQHGVPTQGAVVTVRQYDGAVGPMVEQKTTNADGAAYLQLDASRPKYVVEVTYRDHGSNEWWWYGYILTPDWSSAYKQVQRMDPWIDTVTLPTAALIVDEPQTVQVTIGHGYTDTDWRLYIRVRMWIDDDGLAPYLYEMVSETQSLYEGISPFELSFTPDAPGHYRVRFMVERNWEDTDWYVADEGGFSWELDVESSPPLACVITGSAFVDWNRDAVRGQGESAAPAVPVVLHDAAMTPLRTVHTDTEGIYRFEQVEPGSYRIGLEDVPRGWVYAGPVHELECAEGMTYEDLDFPLWVRYVCLPLVQSAP
ncbi:MAG: hypothetical protein JXA74_07880 [Anaerolineae bacterium]|nr:hypothetical protein [Anaerolineae bacterium]